MQYIKRNETIPIAGNYDVIVAGGGLSGVAAALSAARQGKKTLLLEKEAGLGGLATLGLVNTWVPLCNGRGKQVICGMAEELLRLSIQYGYDTLPDEWKNGEPKKTTNVRYTTRFSIGLFSLALVDLLHKTGVTIFYNTLVSSTVMRGGHCCGLIVDGKSGRQYYEAQVVVDATGDADILARAGVPTIEGKNFFTMYTFGVNLDGCKKAVENRNILHAYTTCFGGEATLYGQHHPEGMPEFLGVSAEMINDFLLKNQLALFENVKKQPRMERDLPSLPSIPQLRTTRRIDGDETLKMEDLYKHKATSVGVICDFEHRDRLFEVPFGALVHCGFDNIITCGRSAAGEGWCWDVLRVIPPAVLTGQAAGLAAAQSIDTNHPIYGIQISELQKSLENTGVIIHFNDAWVPKNLEVDTFVHLENHL